METIVLKFGGTSVGSTDRINAVANLIKEAPQELTGECNVWKNYVDFPVGKM